MFIIKSEPDEPFLSRQDSIILKAWAIILIVFHNFFHQLTPVLYENEFNFGVKIFPSYVVYVTEQPSEFIRAFFSFYGHFGVTVFIVLSAYGLTFQYGGRSFNYLQFLLKRLWRLYPVFIMAIGVHALFIAWWRPESWSEWGVAYAAKLSLLTNFIPGLETKVSGPWWFFSLVVQYYLMFSLIDRLVERWGLAALSALVSFGWATVYFIDPLTSLQLKFTFIGWLPEIALGIGLAKGYRITPQVLIALGAMAIFSLGHFSREAWVLSSFSFGLLFMLATPKIIRLSRLSLRLSNFLMFVGSISFPLFAIHGPIRFPFQKLAEHYDVWWFTVTMACLFFATAILVSLQAHRLDRKIASLRTGMICIVSLNSDT